MSESGLGNYIHTRLDKVRKAKNKNEIFVGTFQFFFFLIGIFLFAVVLETLFKFGSNERTVVFAIFVGSVIIGLMLFVVRPFIQYVGLISSYSDETISEEIGAKFPSIRDRLHNLLQLEKEYYSGTSLYSLELIEASFADLRTEVEGLNFLQVIDKSKIPLWRRNSIFISGIAGFLFLLLPNTFSNSYFRLWHFRDEFLPPVKYSFEIHPGDKEIVKGESVDITIRVSPAGDVLPGAIEEKLTVLWREEGREKYNSRILRIDSAGAFKTKLEELRTTTIYSAEMGNEKSAEYHLSVLDRPIIKSFQLRLDFPSYTRLPSKIQEEFAGDVTAPVGTKVFITASASIELSEAYLIFNNIHRQFLKTRAIDFLGGFTVLCDSSYKVIVQSVKHLTNINPIEYCIKAIQDNYPTVSILEPGRNIDIAGVSELPLLIVIDDDYGFNQLRIGYRLVHSRYERIRDIYIFTNIPLPQGIQNHSEISFNWNISGMHLAPEDVVEYFAEVTDNDAVTGPKISRSKIFLIRLPSLEEVFTDVRKDQNQMQSDMKDVQKEAKKLREEVESLQREMKKNKESDWQQQKKAGDLVKKYQELQKKLEEAKNRLDQMVGQMQQQNVLSPETMQKYMELQQLLTQLNSEMIQKALRQMQQAMQNVDRQQMQEAMLNLQFSEERFRQSIDRTITLLKRLYIEQKVDEVKKRAENLVNEQKQLQDETRQNANEVSKRDELARKQEELAKKQQELEKESEALERQMEEFFTEMPVDQLSQMNQQMKQKNISGKMQKSSQMMRQGKMQSTQQLQQESQDELQQFAQQISEMQQQMLQQQTAATINSLRKAIKDLLELSRREEELMQQAQGAPPNSPQLRQNAQNQLGVKEDLGSVINNLTQLSERSFVVTPEMGRAIGEALARMNSAMEALDVRNGQAAALQQREAMAALNRAAMQVQNALSNMMKGGAGSGGLMSQLQMMAQQQMGINAQTQRMMGQGMSAERAAQAARLAQEQAALQRSLEELNREAQQSGEQKRLLGDLQKIADEMREVAKELNQENINPEILNKQEKILSRLLEASRSLRERDYEKKRRAQTGTPIQRKSPTQFDPNAVQQSPYDDLLTAPEKGYTKDYQELIRRYYEALQREKK